MMDLSKRHNHTDLITLLTGLTQSKDTSGIILTQKSTLHQYEETNEMMRQFLNLSDFTYKKLSASYAAHIKTLNSLQKDLEQTFKKIRVLKTKLMESYPEAFQATADAIKEFQLRYEMEDEQRFCSDQFVTEKKKIMTEIAEDAIETEVDDTNNGRYNKDVIITEQDVVREGRCYNNDVIILPEQDVVRNGTLNENFEISSFEANLNIAPALEIENSNLLISNESYSTAVRLLPGEMHDEISSSQCNTTMLQNDISYDVTQGNYFKINDLSLSIKELSPISDEENVGLEKK